METTQITDISVRTPDVIAAEIAVIKEQTKKILLVSAVEIGRRLIEAKEKVPNGQFVTWLGNAVQYSERTAYNLMRLAEEYGPGLSDGADSGAIASAAGAKMEPLTKLSYTHALVLLGLPSEERAEFMAQFDLENTTARELQQAVKDRNKALAEKAALEKECDSQKSTISKLTRECAQTKKEAHDHQQSLWAEQEKITTLRRKLDTLESDSAAARRIAEIERENQIAKINLSMAQADARFDLIAKGFDDLFTAIKEMAPADPKAFKLYLQQTNQFLAKTSERLRRIEKAPSPAPSPYVPADLKTPTP